MTSNLQVKKKHKFFLTHSIFLPYVRYVPYLYFIYGLCPQSRLKTERVLFSKTKGARHFRGTREDRRTNFWSTVQRLLRCLPSGTRRPKISNALCTIGARFLSRNYQTQSICRLDKNPFHLTIWEPADAKIFTNQSQIWSDENCRNVVHVYRALEAGMYPCREYSEIDDHQGILFTRMHPLPTK